MGGRNRTKGAAAGQCSGSHHCEYGGGDEEREGGREAGATGARAGARKGLLRKGIVLKKRG